jgi:AcrR family transcriptional regulator
VGGKQAVEIKRRMPRQKRAVDTVEAIIEASARIIAADGAAALNTNRIAERAGVGIGTLYEYFPNKDAILVAIARRILREDEQAMRAALASALDDPDASVPRIAVRTLLALHERNAAIRRVVMPVHIAQGLGDEHAAPVRQVAGLLAGRLDRLGTEGASRLTEADLFVLTRAVIGAVRAAFEERQPLLDEQALEHALVRLIEGYLSGLGRDAESRVP